MAYEYEDLSGCPLSVVKIGTGLSVGVRAGLSLGDLVIFAKDEVLVYGGVQGKSGMAQS